MQDGSQSNAAKILAQPGDPQPAETRLADSTFKSEDEQSLVPIRQPSMMPAFAKSDELQIQVSAVQRALEEMRLTDQTFDFEGAIAHTRVPVSQPLMPVFEAIANSIDAVAELGGTGTIRVRVIRDGQESLDFSDRQRIVPKIVGFEISDDGIGFNDENCRSFMTRYSRRKITSGGKGLGRFAWFKTFDRVDVVSHYQTSSGLKARAWIFRHGDKKLAKWVDILVTQERPGTLVSLTDFRQPYLGYTPRLPSSIAYRIAEHFIETFLLGRLPSMEIEDGHGGERRSVGDIYKELIIYQQKNTVPIDQNSIQVQHLLLKHHAELPGRIVYCARGRAVESHDPATIVRDVPDAFDDGTGSRLSYRAYVSGNLFESSVDESRSTFDIDRQTSSRGRLFEERPTWEDIQIALYPSCSDFLNPHLAYARETRDDRLRRHIAEAPWYNGLVEARPDLKDSIPVTAGSETIEIHLYRESIEWRSEVHNKGARLLEELKTEGPEFIELRDKVWEHQKALSAGTLDDLARYIGHRRSVLDWLDKCLKLTNGKHVHESIVHDVFFRRGYDSHSTRYFEHNLWILDEQLTFHQYAVSDKPLSKHEVLDSNNGKEPDIVTYSHATFTEQLEDESVCKSVVIVEFKRPGRETYGSKDDPIAQVRRYADLIARGTVKREDGTSIEVDAGTKYFGYVIADPADKLTDLVDHYEMRPLANGHGWYRQFDAPPRPYIEMLTYQQALTLAKRRNGVFFHLLGIRRTQ